MDAWEAVHELRAAGRAGGGRRARVAYLGREQSVPLPRGTLREVAGGSVSLSPPSGRFTWRRKGPLFRRSAVVGAGGVGPVALGHQGPFERQVP